MYLDHLQNWLVHGHGLLIFSCDQAALQMAFSVCPSVCPSVCLSHLFDYVPIIRSSWNFQELLPMTRERSMQKVKVTEVTTQLNRFRTVTPGWVHIWWWNDAYSLMLLRRGALLLFKVIRQISRSHGSKNRRIWPKLAVSGLSLKFEYTNGYKMMHKAWSSIGVCVNGWELQASVSMGFNPVGSSLASWSLTRFSHTRPRSRKPWYPTWDPSQSPPDATLPHAQPIRGFYPKTLPYRWHTSAHSPSTFPYALGSLLLNIYHPYDTND